MPVGKERRGERRGLMSHYWNPVYGALRAAAMRADTFVGALEIFLVAGFVIALAGTFIFVGLASYVRTGVTQSFDESVLRWMGAHHSKLTDSLMLEITALGTGMVVMMIVLVAGLFLMLTQHKYSALLLLVSTFGGLVLNTVLKMGFHRPRPQVIEWGTQAVSSSFPSGHAMSAAIVYSTVAYLAARLHRRLWARWAMMILALVLIVAISASRMYLGVHYPSDVVAGVVIGFAWAGFCMATLEAIQRYAERRAPEVMREEKPAPPAS